MGFFSIDAADFEWIDGKEDNSTDLFERALHSNAVKNGNVIDMKMYALIKKQHNLAFFKKGKK